MATSNFIFILMSTCEDILTSHPPSSYTHNDLASSFVFYFHLGRMLYSDQPYVSLKGEAVTYIDKKPGHYNEYLFV